jgi:glycosyltransferase involved in cell wall biosynthesis
MKILHIISSMAAKAGGTSQFIRYVIPPLEGQGIQNEVVTLDAPDANFLGSDSFLIHSLGPSKSSWAYSPRLLPWLIENLACYDVVIQHGLWQYPGYALLQEMKRLRKAGKAPRWYIYPHGMLDPWFQKARSRRLKALRNEIYWRLIEKRVVNSAEGLLFTCEEELCQAATAFRGYRPKAVHNVGYGIPEPPDNVEQQLDAFYGVLPHLKDQPVLLFLSRIHPKKGVDLLLKAFAQVRQESGTGQGAKFPKLVIAGPCANASYWNELQSLAVNLGLQKEAIPFELLGDTSTYDQGPSTPLIWPGMLTGDKKWGALRSASAFILPSHQENFGIAVVEALACGTPVLISNKVNIWRDIEEYSAGKVGEDTLEGTVLLLQHSSISKNFSLASQHASLCFNSCFGIQTTTDKIVLLLKT